MQTSGRYMCAYCGQENVIPLDPDGGQKQEYIEDCQTCCRPNVIRVTFSANADDAQVDAEQENEW